MGAFGNAAHAMGGDASVSAISHRVLARGQSGAAAEKPPREFCRGNVQEAIGGRLLHSKVNCALAFGIGVRTHAQW
jgi:hypothetical protein